MKVLQYTTELENIWDNFVLEESVNGTFLQTRNFLNYHPIDRFKDCSLLFMEGANIAAVIPACLIFEGGSKVFHSHMGSTFGGVVMGSRFYELKYVKEVIEVLDEYLTKQYFHKAILKLTGPVFSDCNQELIEYLLYLNGYKCSYELSSFVNCCKLHSEKDIFLHMSKNKRRDCRVALRNHLKFLPLTTSKQIGEFYEILILTLKKYDANPVHTLEELCEFKFDRLKNNVEFFGVYYDDILIAGCMVFKFSDQIMHTQYLAANPQYLKLYSMNFIYFSLIKLALERNLSKLSWGISTQDSGKRLNYNLATFKEAHGSEFTANKTFTKIF